jgi:hypothetical protein
LYFSGSLIEAQAQKCGVAQPGLCRPFYESDLRHKLRFRPVHFVHLICRDACAPAPDISVRKIDKGAVINL